MTNRRTLVAANWKMNGSIEGSRVLAEALIEGISAETLAEVAVCPSFVYLSQLSEQFKNTSIKLGAQNVSHLDEGAYTGEVAASMLVDFGCEYVIVGHSERRMHYRETDSRVAEKFSATQLNGMTPILCIGETIDERSGGHTEVVLKRQLFAACGNIDSKKLTRMVIAYEPVWAIGTGINATNDIVAKTHNYIRSILTSNGLNGDGISVLYGGSVSIDNAAELSRIEDVDGFLIGGASLDVEKFYSIYKQI